MSRRRETKFRGRVAIAAAVLAAGSVSVLIASSAVAAQPANYAQTHAKVISTLGQLKGQAGKKLGAIASQWPSSLSSPCQNPKTHPDGKLVVGFSYSSRANPWQVQNAIGSLWYLKHNSAVAKVYGANGEENPSKQISDIESLISKNIDVLVVDPATSSVSPGVREACMRGITTVVYDRFVTAQTPTTANMYANEVQDGYNGGEAIVKALGGKGNVVIIPGIPGAGVTEDRVKGAKLAFAKAPGIKVLGTAYSNWDPATGRKIMEDFLTKYPKIDAIWSDAGVQAVGIIQALKESGRLKSAKLIVGGQANGFLKLCHNLKISCYGSTISTDVGILASQLAIDIATGKYKTKVNVPAPLVVISQAQLKDYVRLDLPDSYWATQVLPNSILKTIFHA